MQYILDYQVVQFTEVIFEIIHLSTVGFIVISTHLTTSAGSLLAIGGFLWFMFTGSISAIRFGVILGVVLFALSLQSLRLSKSGQSSALLLKSQAGQFTYTLRSRLLAFSITTTQVQDRACYMCSRFFYWFDCYYIVLLPVCILLNCSSYTLIVTGSKLALELNVDLLFHDKHPCSCIRIHPMSMYIWLDLLKRVCSLSHSMMCSLDFNMSIQLVYW